MKGVTDRTIVENHDFAEVRLYLTDIFDVCSVTERAMLTVIPRREILALQFEPINNGICILLNRGSEHNQIVPFADLQLVRQILADIRFSLLPLTLRRNSSQ